MKDIFLYNSILCFFFLFLNICKIGLKGKSILVPSTLFSLMWGMTSLGCYLYANNIIQGGEYYRYASFLDDIGTYQFKILLVCFLAFLLARISVLNCTFDVPKSNHVSLVNLFLSKFRWILYVLFILGMIRLVIVLSLVGFNYSDIRLLYITGRSSFSTFDLNLIRITSYVLQVAVFYVCVLGVKMSMTSINFKELYFCFILFAPFQMSFGGRLFILSFFMPFLFAYFAIKLQNVQSLCNKTDLKKIVLLILFPLFLIIFFQVLKMNDKADAKSIKDRSNELFYTTSIYMHLNELWRVKPVDFNLGLGRNIMPIGFESPEYTKIKNNWSRNHNNAAVCVPSMIPSMYFDFGEEGSYIIYFVIFFLLEYIALCIMHKFVIWRLMIYILLCMFAFNTTASSMSDNFKTLIVGLFFVLLISNHFKKVSIQI
jgi:oligosaccharide repeat unit polymerase